MFTNSELARAKNVLKLSKVAPANRAHGFHFALLIKEYNSICQLPLSFEVLCTVCHSILFKIATFLPY